MEIYVQLATIISPFVALIIAGITAWLSARDSSKKIEAMEKNTEKQIEKIIILSKFQASLASSKMDMALWETHFRFHELSGLTGDVLKDNRNTRENLHNVDITNLNEEELSRHQQLVYFDRQLSNLEGHIKHLWKEMEELKLV